MSEKLTREQLFDLVWAKPLAAVASDLGLSAYLLVKQCRQKNVPTPTYGYWTKIANGKVPRKPVLPAERPPPATKPHYSQWPRELSGLCERAQLLAGELSRLKPNHEGLQSLEDRYFPKVKVTRAMIEPAARLFHAIVFAVERSGVPFRKARSK